MRVGLAGSVSSKRTLEVEGVEFEGRRSLDEVPAEECIESVEKAAGASTSSRIAVAGEVRTLLRDEARSAAILEERARSAVVTLHIQSNLRPLRMFERFPIVRMWKREERKANFRRNLKDREERAAFVLTKLSKRSLQRHTERRQGFGCKE